jgi:hypothetical protein
MLWNTANKVLTIYYNKHLGNWEMQNGVQLFGFLPEAKNMSIFLPVHSDQIK